ncbi:hypothetical protein Taro_013879 [Colocasia esculenta]|uniref:DYW domain-containing protein n=1 Tax=Colocasia esculenta TaxID=4460 RepID=A0A843UHC4_COLES|nr:hypothetical protein [Colocasia esculenta]
MAKGLPTSSSPAPPAASALRSLHHPPRRHAGCGGGSSAQSATSPSSAAAPSVYHPLLLLLARRLQHSRGLRSVLSAHARVLKSGLSRHATTANHLINAYVRHGDAAHAEHAFEDMSGSANVVSWTSVMAGHVAAGRPDRALSLLRGMPEGGVRPNAFTLCTAVNACAALAIAETGRQVHAVAEVSGLRNDLVVSTALVDMYGKSNRVDDARHVFDRMQCRNVVSWGSMLWVHAQNARAHEVLDLFGQFLRNGDGGGGGTSFPPNHFMLCSVVSACASLGRLGPGKSAHAAVIRRGHGENDVIDGALVDMYAKCGCIEYSQKVFRQMDSPTVIPFTAMIVAAARHGLVNVSLEMFDDMLARGLRPNEVTFVGVLHACSHAGLVDRGLEYLDSMSKSHGVRPSSKHYTCAVDMLGRAGRVDEAYDISKGMEVEGEEAVLLWTTLLSAGRKHRRLDIVEMARARLREYGKDMAGAYVMMSNTYAAAGRWENAVGVRMEMVRRGIRKDPGCSWVEVKDAVHVFYVGDASSCGRGEEVLQMVRELEEKMREMGYAHGGGGAITAAAADDEEPAGKPAVGLHSEMLALAFALIGLPNGGTIRVMKNLRMCGDCHEAFKLASVIVGRKLVVRDLNRFHHFSGGTCTCGDYW